MPVKKTTRKKPAVKKAATRKVVAKKAVKKVAKKTTAKSKPAKKAVKSKVAVKKSGPAKPISDKLSGTQLHNMIAESTGLTRKQVASVFDELSNVMEGCLKKRGVGEFALPKLAKFVVKQKPATKARKGINPFTGEEIMIKAKPASRVVKVRPLKKVKEMAA